VHRRSHADDRVDEATSQRMLIHIAGYNLIHVDAVRAGLVVGALE
jgi:hypothetical protein